MGNKEKKKQGQVAMLVNLFCVRQVSREEVVVKELLSVPGQGWLTGNAAVRALMECGLPA
jgi:hypothetical protein